MTVVLALVVGVLFYASYHHGRAPHGTDSSLYRELAASLADGTGYTIDGRPTAKVPPVYPLLLVPFAAVGRLEGYAPALFGLLLGALAAGFIALIARRAFGPTEGIVAGVLAATLPSIAFWSPYVLTDTLALALLAASLLVVVGREPVSLRAACLTGLLLGAGLLTRPAMAFAAAAIVASLILRNGPWRGRLLSAAAAAITTLLVLAPWALRNDAAVGAPYFSTSYAGANLWVAVHWTPEGRGTVGADVPPLPVAREPGEVASDRLLRKRALQVLNDHPGRFLRGLYEKPRLMWVLWAPEYGLRGLGETWLTLLGIAAGLGFLLSPAVRRGGVWWILVAAGLTLGTMLSYMDSDLRYRLPLAAVVVPPAAAAVVAAARAIAQRRRSM